MSGAFSPTGTAASGRDPLVPPDDGALRLVLVRHGRTPANVSRALDTALPGSPLDELGVAQAAEVARLLAGWPVRAVFASRAARARQTAEPIAARHGLAVTVLDGVQEISVGDLEGRHDPDARRVFDDTFASWWAGDPDLPQPGGESATDLLARYLPAVERALTGVEAGAVVLVSHGAAIRLSTGALLRGRPGAERGRDTLLPNTGRVVLRREAAGWALEHWDPQPGP